MELEFPAEDGIDYANEEFVLCVNPEGDATVGIAFADDTGPAFHDEFFGRILPDAVFIDEGFEDTVEGFAPAMNRPALTLGEGAEVSDEVFRTTIKRHRKIEAEFRGRLK